MRRFYWIAGLTLLFSSGCAMQRNTSPSPVLLGETPEFSAMRSFQKLLNTETGTPAYERGRVEYLLERLTNSPYNFVRNEMTYTNRRAVMHLRWKYLRKHDETITAEQFADRIAASSKKSGQPYLMQVSPNKVYPLRIIFHHELDLLDETLAAEKGAASQPQGT